MKNYKFLILAITLLLTSCNSGPIPRDYLPNDYKPEAKVSVEKTSSYESASSIDSKEFSNNSGDLIEVPAEVGTRKIIRTFYYNIDTKTFENDYNLVLEITKKYDGFETNSNRFKTAANDYLKRAELQLKIPTEKSEEFKKELEKIGVVTRAESKASDITYRYVNNDKDIELLNLQLDSMKKMLEKAETMEDLIKIQEKIDVLTFELNEKTQDKAQMDFSVDYDTYEITLVEVVAEKIAASDENSFGSRASQQFQNSLYNLKMALSGLVLWIIGSWYVIVFWILVFLLARFLYRKNSVKIREAREDRHNKRMEKERARREKARAEKEEYLKYRNEIINNARVEDNSTQPSGTMTKPNDPSTTPKVGKVDKDKDDR